MHFFLPPTAKRKQQQIQRQLEQQPSNKTLALAPGDNMTQGASSGSYPAPQAECQGGISTPNLHASITPNLDPAPPLHTKLDMQKVPEGADAAAQNAAAQNAATIILTPTSLNLTNTTQNVAANNGGSGSGNGAGAGVHGDEYRGPKW